MPGSGGKSASWLMSALMAASQTAGGPGRRVTCSLFYRQQAEAYSEQLYDVLVCALPIILRFMRRVCL
jgi:hypothetical protein